MENSEKELIERVNKILNRNVMYESMYKTISDLCDRIDELESGKPTWMK